MNTEGESQGFSLVQRFIEFNSKHNSSYRREKNLASQDCNLGLI